MKVFLSLILSLALTACIGTSEVDRSTGEGYFPRVSGQDLTGVKRQLPETFKTEYMILLVAFLQEQQRDVDQWFPHIEALMKKNTEIEYLEIPTIAKLAAPIRQVIYNGMRGGIKSEWMRCHVVTLHLDKEEFKEHLAIDDEKQVYVFLVDKKGKVLHREEGLYNQEKWQNILKVVKQ